MIGVKSNYYNYYFLNETLKHNLTIIEQAVKHGLSVYDFIEKCSNLNKFSEKEKKEILNFFEYNCDKKSLKYLSKIFEKK